MDKKYNMKVTSEELEEILGIKLSSWDKDQIEHHVPEYAEISESELQKYICHFIDVLTDDIVFSGKHRLPSWETGWEENLKEFTHTENIQSLIPKYHRKGRLVRWKDKMVSPSFPDFDYQLHKIIVDVVIRNHFKDVKQIVEFGCGPGYHLARISNYFPDKKLIGTDWTKMSQTIIKEINRVKKLNIKGYNFDFFSPDYTLPVDSDTGIYTIAALEQVGKNFSEFVNFLLQKKPAICVHFEPIGELLPDDNVLCKLTKKYFQKRNYLDGYLTYLETLEKDGKIQIIDKRRTYSGSFYIEGHSLIVWKPL